MKELFEQDNEPNTISGSKVVIGMYVVVFIVALSVRACAQCPGDTWETAPEIVMPQDGVWTENICNGSVLDLGWMVICQYDFMDENFVPTCTTSDYDYFRKLILPMATQVCLFVETTGEFGYVRNGYQPAEDTSPGLYGGVQLFVYDMTPEIIWATCEDLPPDPDTQYIFADLGWLDAGEYMIRVDGESISCGCADLTIKTLSFLDMSVPEHTIEQMAGGQFKFDNAGRLIRK